MRNGSARLFRVALAASLSLSALLYFAWSWRWPLVGDASLMHYMGWLIERGWAPYRDFGDMNMPGSYLIELAAMHLFGMGDLAWRLFDFTLMGAAAASFFVITRRTRAGAPSMTVSSSWVGPEDGWLAGLFAACLFILVHGRDGLAEGGQRDLTMAVCLIVATAFLFVAIRRDWPWAAAAFGLFSGVALTIKPTALPLTVAQLLLAVYVLRGSGTQGESPNRRWLRHAAAAILGYLIAPGVALIFLLRERALAAFFANLHGLVLYYSGLGHRPLGFLLLHSISPLLPLILLWLAVLALHRPQLDWERAALGCGALFGLVSYLVQARGFPYYRYTLLIFLLPLMAVDFTRAAQTQLSDLWRATAHIRRTKAARWLALAALSFGGFVLAPQSAVLVHRYRWWETRLHHFAPAEPRRSGRRSGSPATSSASTPSPAAATSSTACGSNPRPACSSDFLLFGPDDVPIIRQTREQFSAAVLANPPQVIVVTSPLHIDGPGDYRKLDRWPAFESFLADDYTLQTEWSPTRTARWWSREETPASYRIYVLRTAALRLPALAALFACSPHP